MSNLDTKNNRVTFVGHATFLLTTPSGQVALIDPWVAGNPACPESLKKISKLNTIFITHAHTDHVGDLLSIAKQFQPKIVCVNETGLWLNSKGFDKQTVPMGKGGTVRVGDFEVTMTHADHSNSIQDGDAVLNAGDPAGLIVRMPGGFCLYHAGDTGAFGDMKMIGELHKPDVAFLPIGDRYTMGPREAAYAIRLLGVKHVVPMHYATFPFLTGTPESLRKETADIAGLQLHLLKPGDNL
jgi:L-ascorbate metabolism protein UlaG (beta-lactamase superfamily)